MEVINESMMMIAYGGESKNYTFQAIKEARGKNFEKSEEILKKADESLSHAHESHSKLLTAEANKKDLKISLFLVHASDHLNSAITIRELANEIIYMYKELEKNV